MNKLSKLFVFFIVTLALISSCTTTKEVDDGILRVNGHVVSFDLDGGKFKENEYEKTLKMSKEEGETILLPEAEKDYFIFGGWNSDSESGLFDIERSKITQDTIFKANWVPVSYAIIYDLDGFVQNDYVKKEAIVEAEPVKVEEKKNPNSYTVLDSFTLINPTKEGFDFLGWRKKGSNGAPSYSYVIKKGTTGKVELETVWLRKSYIIKYDLNQGKLNGENPAKFVYDKEPVTLLAPERDYYDFVGWLDSETGKMYKDSFTDTKTSRDVTLTAVWSPIVYSITYDYDGGVAENPREYTFESETFTLSVPTRKGYTFTSWQVEESVDFDPELFKLSADINGIEVSLSVHNEFAQLIYPTGTYRSFVESTVTYLKSAFPDLEISANGTIISIFFQNKEKSQLELAFNNLLKDLGIVTEYTESKIETKEYEDITIEKGSHGNRRYKAQWEIDKYSLSFGNDEIYDENSLVEEVVYPAEYTVLDEVSINNPEKFGYDFIGWMLGDEVDYSGAEKDVTIEKGSVGDRVYTPLFKIHEYTLKLDLDGGTLNGVSYPEKYNIYDDSIVIDAVAEKANYTFVGWFYNNEVSSSIIINPKDGKDSSVKAIWKANVYSIDYDLNGGEYPLGTRDNLTQYTVETKPFNIVNPVKDKYVFTGWVNSERENRDYPVVDYIFNTLEGGDVSLKATWKVKEYNIYYNLNGGRFTYSDSNPSSFTNFDEPFTLVAPERKGYSFVGYVDADHQDNKPIERYIVDTTNLRNDLKLASIWKAIDYPIYYDLNGGNYLRGLGVNKTSYTVNDSPFALVSPVMNGFTFLGWVRSEYKDTDVPQMNLVVDTSILGGQSFSAIWQANEYTINYYLDGGEYQYGNSNPERYTPLSSFVLTNPVKEGYTFLGWVKSGDSREEVYNTYRVNFGTIGNLSFFAIYEKNEGKLGEATRKQKENMVYGKDNIARPDWVISPPMDGYYHYERAYGQGNDIIEAVENAKEKCLNYFTQFLSNDVEILNKTVNGVDLNTKTQNQAVDLSGAEMVEYWEDGVGGVWLLMRIEK